MNRALIRRYDVGGFDQDLEHQMLQTEIEYRLHRSNIPRDFFSVQHKDEPKEDLAEELAKTLTIDTAEVDPGFAARASGLVEEADGLGSQPVAETNRYHPPQTG